MADTNTNATNFSGSGANSPVNGANNANLSAKVEKNPSVVNTPQVAFENSKRPGDVAVKTLRALEASGVRYEANKNIYLTADEAEFHVNDGGAERL